MKAIMTVIGPDRVGIIAGVSNLLAQMNVNILDLSQTIMKELFTMTVLVDTAGANCSFEEIKRSLKAHGAAVGLDIHIQREDTFTAMHKI